MIRPNLDSRLMKTPQNSLLTALVILLIAGAVTVAQRNPKDPSQWPATRGSMLSARSSACSVLLPDGRVLITGGVNGDLGLSSAEYFANGRFSQAPEMAQPRSNHACAVLPNGTVLVAGGRTGGGMTNTTEILDLKSNAWKPGPSLPSSRAGATLATLKGGRLLLAGGEVAGMISDELLIFDHTSGAFPPIQARLSSPRRDHAMAALKDGRILIAGGFDGEKFLDSIDLFDPATATISSAGKLSVARSRLTATTLLDGRVVFLGGGDNRTEYGAPEVYDPKTGAVSLEPSMMTQPRRGHAAIRVPDNNTIQVIGGTAAGQPISQNEAYVPWRHRFQNSGTLDDGRTGATVLSLAERGQTLVAGGAGPVGALATAHVACVPTVSTDKADYAPGTTVVITGSCWTAGGSVQITLTETPDNFGESPITITPSLVAVDGTFTNTTFAPDVNDLGVTFFLTATESADGNGNPMSPPLTAQTSFTDALGITSVTPNSGPPAGGTSVTITGSSFSSGQAPFTVTFGGVAATTVTRVDNNTLTCVTPAHSQGAVDVVVTDKNASTATLTKGFTYQNTALTVIAASGAYGGTTGTITATLTAGGAAVTGKSISFSLNGGSVGSATTNSSGVATLNNASLTLPIKINAGTYTAGVGARFTGDPNFAAATATNTLTVTPKAITVTAATNTKTYDGTTSAAAAPTVTGGLVTGDTGNFTESYDNKTAGTGKTLTPAGSVSDSNSGANYAITFVNNPTGVITARSLTVTATGVNKVYDGATNATVTLADDRVTADVLTDSYGGALFGNKNVGTGKTVNVTGISISGADAVNYTANTTANTTADITARSLTVTATGVDKVYDGTTAATVTLTDNRVSGDVLTTGFTSATFTTGKAVGTTKPVSVTGISITGTDAGNYTFNTTATTTASITPRTLHVTATGQNKVYDGTITASVTFGDDRVSGDNLTVTGSAAFADKNVGTAKPLSVTGISVTGPDVGNYTFNTTTAATADITARPLTVSVTGVDKIYDGTTGATVTLSDNKVNGDTVTEAYTSASFADKNVGAAKTVNVAGISISGADAGNYTLSNTTATATAKITPRALTVSATGVDKVYDGTTAATVTLTDNRVSGDVLTAAFTSATFTTGKAVGTTKPVSVTGISITGTDAGNYTFNTTATTTASITLRTLHVTATGQNKVYDGNTNAIVKFGDDRVAGDTLTVSDTAIFSDKNVGTNKAVSVSGITISGADATNYTLGNTTYITAADITPRTLTVTATAANKVYDGATTATVTLADDRIAGDNLTDSFATAAFNTKNVGNGTGVSVSGISISGVDAGNYNLSNTTATATANITPRGLTVSATGNAKLYDGTTAATVTLTDNRVSGDMLTDSYTSATFSDKNVGSGKTVSVAGISISGPDAGNYTFNLAAITTANITARALHVAATGVNKVYDGTQSVSVVFSDDRIMGDQLTVSDTAMFLDKNVGINKPVVVNGIYISGGVDAGNYILANTTASTTASIVQRPLTVTATGVNKVYDGNTTATVTLADDRVLNDNVTETYTTASFADKAVGTGKTIGVSGISMSGLDAGNYSLQNTTASALANITKRTLNITATGVNKVYDGNTVASVALSDDRVTGDLFIVVYAAAQFATKTVGKGKPVQVTGVAISGADADNYTVSATVSTEADITPRPLHVTATGQNKVYDGNSVATVTFGDDRVAGDYLTVTDSASFTDKNVAVGKTVTVINISVGGSDAGNYNLANKGTSTTASITPRALIVTATAANKVYDGTTTATVTLVDDRVAGDVLTESYGSATFADKNVGAAKVVTVSGISVSSADAGNYTFNSSTATKADITARVLSVSATGVNKVYDGSTTTTVTLSDNRVSGDTFTDSYSSAAFDNKNVGNGKTVSVSGITISGTDAGNYTFNTTATATANIASRPLTVTAAGQNKVYDGNTSATVIFTDNRVAGDVLTVSDSANFADKNVGTGKTVSVTGIKVTGTDAGNYTFSPTATATANITQRLLTVSATGINKAYDGTTSATVNLSDDHVVGDNLTDSYTAASFTDKNVGAGKTITISGISVSGADSGNYSLSNTTATTTASITARLLAVTATGVNKVYDGTAAATVTLADDRLAGDLFADSYISAVFANKNIGSGKSVSVSGISISGTDAGNYTLNTTAIATASITARTLHVTATAQNKVYDGNSTATVTFGDDRVAGDYLTVSDNASFTDKNVGTNKAVSVSGITISGQDATNYSLGNTTATTTASITARSLTISASGVNKVYDGTTSATVNLSDDRVNGDNVTDAYTTASFADRTAAAGKSVSVSGISIAGADSANYSLLNTSAAATANITARTLAVTATGVNKVYDGTTAATVTLADNRIPGDVFTDAYSTAAFADKNAGVGKTMNVFGISISGSDAANYTSNTIANTTGSITRLPITVTAATNSKVYDGGSSALATPTNSGVATGDTPAFSEAYDTKNVGTGKPLMPSGSVNDGNGGNNYTVTFVPTATGVITAAPLSIAALACTKPYDGTIAAPCTPIVTGLQTGDSVTALSETYDTKFAGIGKTLSVAAYSINDGNAGKNYNVTLVPSPAGVITNDPPVVTINSPASGLVSPAGTAITFSSSFTDAPGDTHTAKWTFQDSSGNPAITITGTVTDLPAGGGTVTGSYSFTNLPGVYSVKLTITDANNATGSANSVTGLPAFIVVYDPSAGFVTGGGWIQSNPGAYTPDRSLSGKATFGFVSKYQKGQTVPTGQTQFTFTVGNLDFHSTSYQWLVVSGPMAQYKGNGVINGAGNYSFLLTARDGSAGADGFRIKITDSTGAIVYDNMLSADDSNTSANVQPLGGGSVQIHN